MKIARALKDIPGFKVDDRQQIDTDGTVEGHYNLTRPAHYYAAELPEFFAIETKRWTPSPDAKFWFVAANGEPGYHPYFNDRNAWHAEMAKLGNCFATKELAEAAAIVIRAALSKFHEDNPHA